MENSLILCGGTGAHTAVAFLRLHTLGSPLGFFRFGGKPLDFPNLYLVDQDASDAAGNKPTAWQLAKSLVTAHPCRYDWQGFIGRPSPPELVEATPLPVGKNKNWYERPHNSLKSRFESSPYLDLLASDYQKSIDYSKGMMGSPAMGSLLFKLKEYDEANRGLNHDQIYGQILELRGRVVVAGSGVGGTGASVAPTLAERLAGSGGAQVMAVMILNWFEFDEEEGSDEIRAKAQRRNRLMQENASSALEYYGRNLARSVAAVPVGMPENSLLRRIYTGDVSQPIQESFIHAVGALSGYRHYLSDQSYSPGLYMMGAVERGRLDGRTDIPGGTLQGLANQAATVADLLDVWTHVLTTEQTGRVAPAIYEAVSRVTNSPRQVAELVQTELQHYQEQLRWMDEILGIKPSPDRTFTQERRSRERLQGQQGLKLQPDSPPAEITGQLFHWTAEWVREEARVENQLVVAPAAVSGGQWPDLRNVEGLGVSAESNGDLNRISDANRDAVLEAFVDPKMVTVNGWPHPVAAADFFRFAIQRREKVQLRQLELLLLGIVAGVLEIRPIADREPVGVSLETLLSEYRRKGWDGLFQYQVVYPDKGGRVIGFSSPHTLLAPAPFLSDEEEIWIWNHLWQQLTGLEDGAFWTEAQDPPTWGEHDLMVRQIRSWIASMKSSRTGVAPGWTRIFESIQVGEARVPFGVGTPIHVYWGAPGDADSPLVRVALPTVESGQWEPPKDTRTVRAEDLVKEISGLLAITAPDGREFEAVSFEIPGGRTLQGWWREHLDQLRDQHQIQVWSWDDDRNVILGRMEGDSLKAVRLEGSRLLDTAEIKIASCVPLVQDPVPGSTMSAGTIKYPDLPLKVEYLDLLATSSGRHWLKDAAAGKMAVDEGLERPVQRTGVTGGASVLWKLNLRGRSDQVPVELRLDPADDPVMAHWMVWPSFRAPREAGWRAYYVYELTELAGARLDALWVDESESVPRVGLRRAPEQNIGAAAYPLKYQEASGVSAHRGGPPLALCLRKGVAQEYGTYLVPLQEVGPFGGDLELGIDFGTSHSSASVRLGGRSETVALAPELNRTTSSLRLSLAISEAWKPISETAAGIYALHGWLPTFREAGGGFLPSELILMKPIKNVQAQDLRTWVPGADFLIPPRDISRLDLAQYVLADFKWDASSEYFHGKEGELRTHYLSLFLEMVLGDIVLNHAKGVPAGLVKTTFTFPLRARKKQYTALQESFRAALTKVKASTGIDLMMADDVGMFDESRAARVDSDTEGQVTLVADLGGGTLDVFIASSVGDLPEVADSAKIGGNLLLRQIAENPAGVLPADGSWVSNGSPGPREIEMNLRAWMRTNGAPQLFGLHAGDHLKLPGTEVRGFASAAEADAGRRLIAHYFRLVNEFLARYLAGYLYKHWYPNVAKEAWDRLMIAVQLRGNGWKLSFKPLSHVEMTAEIQEAVRHRVRELWRLLPEHDFANPDEAEWVHADSHANVDPKTITAQGVLGRSMRFEDVENKWRSHTLVDLEIRHKAGDRSRVGWYEAIPLDTRHSQDVEARKILPPVVVSSPTEDHEVAIDDLLMQHKGDVQRQLKKEESRIDPTNGHYIAPVAPIIWEAIFGSRAYWPKD